MKPGDLHGDLAAAEDLRQLVDNVGEFVVHPDASPGHPRDVAGAADAADRLAVDERIIEGAWLVVADEPRLELADRRPVRIRGALRHPHAPVVARRGQKILIDRQAGGYGRVLGNAASGEGKRRERAARGKLELVGPGAARLIRGAVLDSQGR